MKSSKENKITRIRIIELFISAAGSFIIVSVNTSSHYGLKDPSP